MQSTPHDNDGAILECESNVRTSMCVTEDDIGDFISDGRRVAAPMTYTSVRPSDEDGVDSACKTPRSRG